MKKTVPVFLAAILIAGCAVLLWNTRGAEEQWTPGRPLGKDRIKVGVLYLSDVEHATGGYSYAHDLGIKEMQRELGLRDDQIIRKSNVSDLDKGRAEMAMRECVASGANVIIATSDGYAEVCEKLSAIYPGVVFAQIDSLKRNGSNLTNFFGRVYQARYLSGIVAGFRTETNKIGYVGAMGRDNSQVTSGLDAFAMGVERANKDAVILVRVTHRWYDPAGEMDAARRLIEESCDVIAQHCDTPNPQVAANVADVWGVGYNTDMSEDAPGTTITSVVWNWGVYYTYLVRSVIDGTFTTDPYFGDIGEGMVAITPLDERIAPPGAMEEVALARSEIESGRNGIFDGVMMTNDGAFIGTEGTTLSDDVIRASINWYYRNIVER
ncbi:MAG: BMP family ABC transporter substrate-binding protein [Synergistaceae bacterium]|jgi:basic membrane protein A|nr:BMP family ABC transporter substrate-binding protein [Synergistaceae bacterium]